MAAACANVLASVVLPVPLLPEIRTQDASRKPPSNIMSSPFNPVETFVPSG